ncbi:MAG: MBL fold metallo-hydrolase [Burkholderiaceae bacterium]|nr:MBL fold metallo-hydrolase [Burkholderiaceae bacterium]
MNFNENNVADASVTPKQKLIATYIGGPTVLIEFDGVRLLTDPTFDAPGQTYEIPRVGAQTTKLKGPGIAVHEIGSIDIVLLSHDEHADNLDLSGKALLPHAKMVVTTKSGAQRLGGNAVGLFPFESLEVGHVKITATPARHGPVGCEPLLGDVIGFIVESTSETFDTFYISGDTVLYDDLAQIKSHFNISTAFLNLGRVGGAGEPHFTMGAEEASQLVELLDLEKIIPLHFEDWAHFSEDRQHAVDIFEQHHLAERIQWLDRGVPTSIK